MKAAWKWLCLRMLCLPWMDNWTCIVRIVEIHCWLGCEAVLYPLYCILHRTTAHARAGYSGVIRESLDGLTGAPKDNIKAVINSTLDVFLWIVEKPRRVAPRSFAKLFDHQFCKISASGDLPFKVRSPGHFGWHDVKLLFCVFVVSPEPQVMTELFKIWRML